MAAKVDTPPAWANSPGAHVPMPNVDMKLVNATKAKMNEEFWRFKDHTRLPKHPAVTGRRDQCWACAKDCDPQKAIFNMRVTERNPMPKDKEATKIKVCIFCSNDCWMGGWPLVRHVYVLAGGDEGDNESTVY
mmetsp:Transcript_32300/g.53406  ORF Transcript_32300/g.53406 Transcript_32300/m.53406 type:complete len:133 (-) Transcript_32300:333-731(-)|eukprot:CAMPEP_0119309796 /NCGR_PEP_ID=MMETSP1333-20130426/16835_1 /TAXON_ID=418940 /ORGANISM="Scyphosphaera apsteinii, Strain RCC1455" /LENGTH=132 /DNA_ID=CAMNT_0007313837 /DNA_START=37 /DNA_END=435 /DNA_ORIENTATION=-